MKEKSREPEIINLLPNPNDSQVLTTLDTQKSNPTNGQEIKDNSQNQKFSNKKQPKANTNNDKTQKTKTANSVNLNNYSFTTVINSSEKGAIFASVSSSSTSSSASASASAISISGY